MSNAQLLYKAYGQVTDFKNYQGLPMPEWDDLPEKIQEAWTAASNAQYDNINIEGRELRQVLHALSYAQQFQDAGVPGHGQFILIAKLARALGFPE